MGRNVIGRGRAAVFPHDRDHRSTASAARPVEIRQAFDTPRSGPAGAWPPQLWAGETADLAVRVVDALVASNELDAASGTAQPGRVGVLGATPAGRPCGN